MKNTKKLRLRWAPASRLVATLLLPALTFALLDGPRVVEAAERARLDKKQERLRAGERARGASTQLIRVLDQLAHTSDAASRSTVSRSTLSPALAERQHELLRSEASRLVTQVADELFAQRHDLEQRGVPEKALRRHDQLAARLEQHKGNVQTPSPLRGEVRSGGTRRRTPLTIPWQDTAPATTPAPDLQKSSDSAHANRDPNCLDPDLCATPEVQLTAAIQLLANQLGNSPARISDWVRQHISFDPYPGALKTSEQVLRTRSGNATDISSLLIALLRASGVKSRYVTGQVTVSGELAASWLGTDTPATAVRLLNAAGLDAVVTAGAGGIAAVTLPHTWVEAYLQYFPSMGVSAAASGDSTSNDTGLSWVGIDTAVKSYTSTAGRDLLSEIAANPAGLLADVSGPPTVVASSPPAVHSLPEDTVLVPRLDLWGQHTRSYLTRNSLDVASAFGVRTLTSSRAPTLTPGLPFAAGTLVRASAVNANDRVRIVVRLRNLDGQTLLSSEVTSADVYGKRWTLMWPPATADDEATVAAVTADPFPAYLIDVKPVLTIEGQPPIVGVASAYGWTTQLEVTVTGPALTAQTTVSEVRVGTPMAFVVAGGTLGNEALYGRLKPLDDVVQNPLVSLDATIGEALTGVALSYLHEEEQLQALVEGATATALHRRLTVVRAAYEPTVTTLFDIPWLASPGDISLYLERRVADTSSSKGNLDDERVSRIATGLVSGALGHQTLEQVFGGKAGSGTRVLQTANKTTGNRVVTIDPSDCNSASLLNLSDDDETSILDLCSAGWRVTVGESSITLPGGSPISGFVAVDPASGRSHIGLLPTGVLGRWPIATGLPSIADTLQLGSDSSSYAALVAPVLNWTRTAHAATEDVAYAFVPGAAAIAKWLQSTGDADPVAFLTSVLAVAGTFETLTARPKVIELTATPRVAKPSDTIHIAGECIYADDWQLNIVRLGENPPPPVQAPGSGNTIAFDWLPTAAPDGVYRIDAIANSGQSSPVESTTIQIDGQPPSVTVTAPDPIITAVAFVPIYGTVQDANLSEYVVAIQGPSDPAFRTIRRASHEVENGVLAVFVARNEQVGQYQLRVTATDFAGNDNQVVTNFTHGYVHDLEPPVVTLTLPPGPQQGLVQAHINVTDLSALTQAELWLDGERLKLHPNPTQPLSWDVEINTWSLANASHPIIAKAKDIHGREGVSTTASLVTDNYISELRAAPAAFDQLHIQPVITARLSGPTDWTAQLMDQASPPVARVSHSGSGAQMQVYWQVNAVSIEDNPYTVVVTSATHTAELNLILNSQNQAPVVSLQNPADSAVVTGLTNIVGTISDDNSADVTWSVAYQQDGATQWETLASGAGTRASATLAQLDPSLLRNGFYTVRLNASDAAETQYVDSRVRVDGELKVGHFTISMQDVTVNVGGIPVTVVRTYDSRDTQGGEFGPGWRLELRSAELEISDSLDVAMTLPDGRRTTFGFFPRPFPNGMFRAEYQSISGVHDTLQPIGSVDLIEIEPGVFTDWDGVEYNPQSFILTTVDGTRFTYGDGKLNRVDDRGGNWIEFGQSTSAITVTSSMGGSLTLPFVTTTSNIDFVREQPYPEIADIDYDYDALGRLWKVQDRNGNITTFEYVGDSVYIDHIDAPGGVALIRNFYDASGRLEKHVDADGHEILYDHNITGRQEVVTDREGRPTVYVYNDRGLVTAVTDPQGRTTHYEYDAAGNQTAVVDPKGNRTEYEYDSKGRVTLVRDALGRETSTTYDGFGNVLTSTDALGRISRNTYDGAGRLLTTTNPINEVVTTNTYTTSGQLATTTDELGHTTTYEYDPKGRRVKATYHDASLTRTAYDLRGNVQWESYRMMLTEEDLWTNPLTRNQVATEYIYDNGGRLLTTRSPLVDGVSIETTTTYTDLGQVYETTDGKGHVTKNEYDQQGRMTTVKHRAFDATEFVTLSSYTYDANGQRLTETDEEGRVTRSLYDTAGRLVRTTYPDQSFTATAYDEAGRVTSTQDRNGNFTYFEYDALGRQVAVIDALNRRTESEYDEVGNLKLTRDPAQRETRFFYDALNRRIRTTLSDGTETRTEYDESSYQDATCNCQMTGRLQREIDQLGRATAFQYDGSGRLVEVRQWNESRELTTKYEYDVRGNRIAQIDAKERRTEFVYDTLDRLRVKRYPVVHPQTPPHEEHYAYDNNGNLTTKLMPNGESLVMHYDARNRLKTKSSPSDATYIQWSLTYTASGQRDTVSRGAGGDTWRWTYEALTGRLKTFTDPSNRVITYGYDNNGNRTSLKTSTYPQATTFEYDPLNRLTHVHDREGNTTTYTYEPQKGVLDEVNYPNGTSTHYGYDQLDRVESIGHLAADLTPLASFQYELSDNGRRDEIVEQINNVASAVEYTYDDLDRLTGEERTGANAYTITFDYDDVGNRLIETRNQTSETHYTYDERDRLLCESTGLNPLCQNPTTSYLWDANGRMVSKNSEIYTWDVEDRMLSHEGGTTTTFAYDIDGIRYRKVANATTTDYLIDANRTYQEVLEEWQGGTQPAMEYLHGMGLLWQRNSSGVQSYFHGDAQMSTRLLTTSAGGVQTPFTYEAFGTDVGLTGPAATTHRYTGQQFDAATGLYYLRARYFDSGRGSFLSTDPYPGELVSPTTLNRFLYATASPVNRQDPTGRFSVTEMAVGGAVAGLLFGMSIGGIRAYFNGAGLRPIAWEAAKSGAIGLIVGAVMGALGALSVTSVLAASLFNTGLLVGFGSQALYASQILQDSSKSKEQKAFEVSLVILAAIGMTRFWASGPAPLTAKGSPAKLAEAIQLTKASSQPFGQQGRVALMKSYLKQISNEDSGWKFSGAEDAGGIQVFWGEGLAPGGVRNVLALTKDNRYFKGTWEDLLIAPNNPKSFTVNLGGMNEVP